MQIMDQNLIRASQEAGFCSRIRYNALPYNLTLLSTGFIQIWLVGGQGGRDRILGWAVGGSSWADQQAAVVQPMVHLQSLK